MEKNMLRVSVSITKKEREREYDRKSNGMAWIALLDNWKWICKKKEEKRFAAKEKTKIMPQLCASN